MRVGDLLGDALDLRLRQPRLLALSLVSHAKIGRDYHATRRSGTARHRRARPRADMILVVWL